MVRNRIVPVLLYVAIALGVFVSPVHAHKVNIFAYAEAGTVYTESYFPDGKAVENGKVEVFDSKGAKLLEGATDRTGKFSFPVPTQDDLNIAVIAGMGHKSSFTLKKSELGE